LNHRSHARALVLEHSSAHFSVSNVLIEIATDASKGLALEIENCFNRGQRSEREVAQEAKSIDSPRA
jgi:hypothetical protein